jgi:hypothetical protein
MLRALDRPAEIILGAQGKNCDAAVLRGVETELQHEALTNDEFGKGGPRLASIQSKGSDKQNPPYKRAQKSK